jgi:ABC-type antimicrobial peptide transport system permease subunit
MDLSSEIYTGAAEYGKFTSLVGFIIGAVVGIILLVVGIILLRKHVETFQTVKGTVVDDKANKCDSRYDQNTKQNFYTCDLLIEFTIDGKTSQKRFSITNQLSSLSTGQTVDLYYNASNPGGISPNHPVNLHIIGGVLIVVGILIAFGGWFMYYTAKKYKFVAAGEGAANVIGMFKRS